MIFSDCRLAQKLERTEARANAAMVEVRARLVPESGAEWCETAGVYAMFDGLASPLTQTFGLGVFDAITHAEMDTLEAFFHRHNAPVFHEVSPMADAAVIPVLNERGYQPCELTSVLYQPLDDIGARPQAASNQQLTTRLAKSGEAQLWAQTSARGWSLEAPELTDFLLDLGQISAQCAGGFPFLAELEDAPIATGMLFIYDEVAFLAGASTVPEGRQRGAQSALLAARLQYAAARGCKIALMGAAPGSQSQRNAEKNGFRIAYTRTKWELKGARREVGK